jgi:molybdopterin/thiamine biosynthesis adenylyltransferase
MIDYSRNWALNQHMIRQGKVTIVGASALTNYLTFYMAGLGLRNIRIIDNSYVNKERAEFIAGSNKSTLKAKVLEEKLNEINEDLNVEAVPLSFHKSFIGNPDVLLDLTNQPKSKEVCLEEFYRNGNINLFVSASSSKSSGSIIFKKNKTKVGRLLSADNLEEYESLSQGSFSSGLLAAVILDEIRKIVSPLEGDYSLLGRMNYGLSLESRFSQKQNSTECFNEKKFNVLLCGAGGIGTYAALNLALEGVGLDIYDGDIIEDHNVARQLFYYDGIGKNKVDVLKRKLEKIAAGTRISVRPSNITKKTTRLLPKYDTIICCADNWEARQVLNAFALESDTPLINASVTAFSAMAESYVPGKNLCLDCMYDFSKLVGLRRQGCAELGESNVVMNNAFIGAFAAGEVLALRQSKRTVLEKKFEYLSKNGSKRRFNVVDKKEKRGSSKCKCKELVKG